MTDGCNMGVKSLNKYLNEYKAADDRAKDKTKRLIELEKKLCEQMHPFYKCLLTKKVLLNILVNMRTQHVCR